ncbi:MAG TPA: histidine utilization repressor [Ochrobactrum sp.]|nr:histidine utilization repressor [Ochrobactrum sp.]
MQLNKSDPANGTEAPRDTPLYERVKSEIKMRIASGEWPEHTRVPSENELVQRFSVSRMTANRALRELATEGLIVRVQGKGSFVAPKKRSAPFMEVRNIAQEIAERGAVHTSRLIMRQSEICGPDLADALEISIGLPIFHSIILHYEDDVPIQLEDRFVNAVVAPDYLSQDFSTITPNAYLSSVSPITHAEQSVEASHPQLWECKLMAIARSEPCLLVKRRTWSDDNIVTLVRLLYPGTRYRFISSF